MGEHGLPAYQQRMGGGEVLQRAPLRVHADPRRFEPASIRVHGPLSGTVECVLKAIKNAVAYEWEQSLDGGNTWTYSLTTTQVGTMLKSLAPKATLHVRFRALLRGSVHTDWSQPVWIIVI
jgi:hypothetical protein